MTTEPQTFVFAYAIEGMPTVVLPGIFESFEVALNFVREQFAIGQISISPQLGCGCGKHFDIEQHGVRGTAALLPIAEFLEQQRKAAFIAEAWARRN